jgi:hypothetical protein
MSQNHFCLLTVGRIACSSSTDVVPTLNLLKRSKYASTTQALPTEAHFFTFQKIFFATFFPCLVENLNTRCSLSSDIPIAARNATRFRNTRTVDRSCSDAALSFLAVHCAVQTGDSKPHPRKLTGPKATS